MVSSCSREHVPCFFKVSLYIGNPIDMKKPSIDEMSKSQALEQLVAISTAGICKKKKKSISALLN
jgi:hypothetical protein